MAKNVLTKPCTVCGQTSVLTLSDVEWAAYRTEANIQKALPHWSTEQRELLITGTHPVCWQQLTADDEEE